MTAKNCTIAWNTLERVTATDSHKQQYTMEVSRSHTCMFVTTSDHPDVHECGTCREWIAREDS